MNHKSNFRKPSFGLMMTHAIAILALTFVGGCGDDNSSITAKKEAVSLLPAEKAEVDKYIQKHGRSAVVHYLEDVHYSQRPTDGKRVLKYVKYLVSQGADVNTKIRDDNFPLKFALHSDNIELVKYLVSQGADVNLSLFYAYDVELVNFLISKGADVNARNARFHYTPLFDAVRGNIGRVKFLVSKGADVNAKDYSKDTPLHYAVFANNLEIVKFLVSKGADVNAKNSGGETPLDWMSKREFYNYGQTVYNQFNRNDEIRKFLESQKIPEKVEKIEKKEPQNTMQERGAAGRLRSLDEVQMAPNSIANIRAAVQAYEAANSSLPDSLDQLTKGSSPLLKKDQLVDAWGTPFQYKKTSRFDFEIRSAGPDKIMNTADDLTN